MHISMLIQSYDLVSGLNKPSSLSVDLTAISQGQAEEHFHNTSITVEVECRHFHVNTSMHKVKYTMKLKITTVFS